MSPVVNPLGDLTWGAWEYASSNGMRVGLQDYGGSGVTTGSTTWTWKMDVWTENQYNYNDDQTLTWSGSASGSLNYHNGQASGTRTMRKTVSCTYTYPANSYGTSPGKSTLSASVSGAYNGVTPSHSKAVPIPARPYAAPNAPGSFTSVRNSDSKVTLTWTNSTTAQKPITSHTIQMKTYTGSTWSGWTTIHTTSSGSTTSYAITTLSTNHSYLFQMRSNNSVGSSGYVAASNQIYMTPAAPSNVVAAPEGATTFVTWNDNAYTSSATSFKVERQVGTGAWTAMVSGIAQGPNSWTDPSPGAGPNTYRVAAVVSVGPLQSGWGYSAATAPINDVWVWNGSAAIPADLYVWDGSAAAPASVEVV